MSEQRVTAEEYLNEHCKPEDWNNLEECLKDSILTNNVIEHMERYAALRIAMLKGESEQLVCEYCNEDAKPTCCDVCLEEMANEVQKAN